MLHRSKRRLLTLAVTGFGLMWLVAFGLGLAIDPTSWSSRYSLLGIGFLGMSTLAMACIRATNQEQVAAHFLEALSELDPHEVAGRGDSLPPLPPSNPFFQSVERFRSAYVEWAAQLQKVEHSRAALEIKARRNAAKLDQMEAILAGLSEPVLVVDPYDSLLLANPSAERLLGLKEKDKVEARVLSNIDHCEKLLDLLNDVRRRKSAGVRTSEVEMTDAQGHTHCYSVSARAVSLHGDATSDAGGKSCAVAVLRDIGNLKAIQKRNAEFVSAVSHEMKTPLAGIKAYVELLADGDADDEATRDEFLEVINGQANRLQRLIDNLLNIARIEAGVTSVHKEPRSLNELLEEAFQIVLPSAEPKRISLTTELSNLYLSVRVDRDMLIQVAINLLSNAIKYTPDGGQVVLRSRMAGDQIQFEVQDTGVGLSAEDCEKVFEKFYRVKKDREMAPGTGLGLALAKHIVEDVHGGTLTVASQPGAGSTFTVTLTGAGQTNT
ncbi:MAG TPA: PAS domain-containing sensor histidine kinase [Pirellulales bacterium]|jgi:two-component system phosphate regulon sensor histidine kinase PhoR|nr:PAS domain-containing sensor histidine kinase [Pirellulales bacterium]